MRLWCIILTLSCALACYNLFGNLAYVNATQLKLYNLKNCTVTCKTGFYRASQEELLDGNGNFRDCCIGRPGSVRHILAYEFIYEI